MMTNNISSFQYRQNENAIGLFDRSGRFFCRLGSWFFKTREGVDYGPYKTRVECRHAYNDFIDLVSDATKLTSESFDFNDTDSDWQPPKISFS